MSYSYITNFIESDRLLYRIFINHFEICCRNQIFLEYVSDYTRVIIKRVSFMYIISCVKRNRSTGDCNGDVKYETCAAFRRKMRILSFVYQFF